MGSELENTNNQSSKVIGKKREQTKEVKKK